MNSQSLANLLALAFSWVPPCYFKATYFFENQARKYNRALAGVVWWIEHCLANQKVASLIQLRIF